MGKAQGSRKMSGSPLRLVFPKMYDYCNNKASLVSDCFCDGEWLIPFRRSFSNADLRSWEELLQLLERVQLNSAKDLVSWGIEKSDQYTARSMYRMMAHRGVTNRRMKKVWCSRMPLKLQVFTWLAFQDKLQTGVELKKRNWKGDKNCNVCGCPETGDHIFFSCIVDRFVWTSFKEALWWDRIPVGMQDFLDVWLPLGIWGVGDITSNSSC